jgi:hypothetical protein
VAEHSPDFNSQGKSKGRLIARAFFPSANYLTSLLMALVVYGIGFWAALVARLSLGVMSIGTGGVAHYF